MSRSVQYVGVASGAIAGTSDVYANLPTPLIAYVGVLYYVAEGSGGFFSGLGVYKYPAGLYKVSADLSKWELTPINVTVATDSLILVNVIDWGEFFNFTFDIHIGDRVSYNEIQYVNLTGIMSTTAPDVDLTNWGAHVDFASRPLTPYKEGRMWYDGDQKSFMMAMGYTGVVADVGKEMYTEVFNSTASVITNGDPISLNGFFTGQYPNVIPTDSSDIFSALAFTGVATMDIPVGETGLITSFGLIKGVNTQSLVVGFIYADSNGWYTQIRPLFPEERILVGACIQTGVTDGILSTKSQRLIRSDLGKSYGFTSQGIGSGLYYKGGFYDWASSDVALNQATPTQTHGTIGRAYAAHVGVVPSGTGIVDTGQVGLRVNGIEDSETGVQVAGQIGIITEDITTLTADVMTECSEKFSGQVILELYVVSGTPVNYSLQCNYGYSKYDDLGNKDFTITGLECVWQGNTTDSVFDIALKHHKPEGWTYAATNFLPGNGDIARKSVDQTLAGDVVNNQDGAWKRVNLDTFINGNESGGILFEIITGANNTIQTMDLHIQSVSEEL